MAERESVCRCVAVCLCVSVGLSRVQHRQRLCEISSMRERESAGERAGEIERLRERERARERERGGSRDRERSKERERSLAPPKRLRDIPCQSIFFFLYTSFYKPALCESIRQPERIYDDLTEYTTTSNNGIRRPQRIGGCMANGFVPGANVKFTYSH